MSGTRHNSVASATAWANKALTDYVRDSGVTEVGKAAVVEAVELFAYARERHYSPAFYLMLATLSEHFVMSMLRVSEFVSDFKGDVGEDPSDEGVAGVVDDLLDAIEWPDFNAPDEVTKTFVGRATELRGCLCELMADLAQACIRENGSTDVGTILEGSHFDPSDLNYEDDNMRILAAVRAAHAALYYAAEMGGAS